MLAVEADASVIAGMLQEKRRSGIEGEGGLDEFSQREALR